MSSYYYSYVLSLYSKYYCCSNVLLPKTNQTFWKDYEYLYCLSWPLVSNSMDWTKLSASVLKLKHRVFNACTFSPFQRPQLFSVCVCVCANSPSLPLDGNILTTHGEMQFAWVLLDSSLLSIFCEIHGTLSHTTYVLVTKHKRWGSWRSRPLFRVQLENIFPELLMDHSWADYKVGHKNLVNNCPIRKHQIYVCNSLRWCLKKVYSSQLVQSDKQIIHLLSV